MSKVVNDFYNFVNGDWESNFNLPSNESEWGVFKDVSNRVLNRTLSVLELDEPSASASASASLKVLHDMYTRLLNLTNSNDRIEIGVVRSMIKALDFDGLRSDRSKLGGILSLFDCLQINPFFGIVGSEDPKNTAVVRFSMYFPILTLPNKIYYFDKSFSDYMDEFERHISNILKFADYDYTKAAQALRIEKLVAKAMKTETQLMDMDLLYSKFSVESFVASIKMCNVQNAYDCSIAEKMWLNYFDRMSKRLPNSTKPEEIVVYDIEYFQKLTLILMTEPIEDICLYLTYSALSGLCKMAIKSYDDTFYDFYSAKLGGQTAETARSTRVVHFLNSVMGEIIGEEYVNRYVEPSIKSTVQRMVENIMVELEKSIRSNRWEYSTKQHALKKLSHITVKIAYADEFIDHTKLMNHVQRMLDRHPSLVEIFIVVRYYFFKLDVLDRIDRPADRSRWQMDAHETNAYYSPQSNEICFPAGLLMEPIFYETTNNADYVKTAAANYGSIGMIIAHELIHGFDDQGRKYDYKGDLFNWWTRADLMDFKHSAQKMVEQYDAYNVSIEDNSVKVNGHLTLCENIADLGGVTLAYRAFLSDMLGRDVKVDADSKRAFFESFAKLWRKKITPEKKLMQIYSDPHAPHNFRVWIIRNIDEWYELYDVKGSPMWLDPANRIKMF